MVEHAVAAAVESGCAEVAVVWGAVEIADLVPADVTLLHNERWSEGQATSLAVAVDHARRVGHDALVVGLGDQPGVSGGCWRAVASADSPIAVATYGGRLRNPVRLHQSVWSFLPTEGDQGARSLVRDRPDLVVQIPCGGDSHDIDTKEDLDRWS